MVQLIKEKKNSETYYYLRHNNGHRDKKRYIGKKIPKKIEELKHQFLMEFYHEEWNDSIQTIIENYNKSTKNLEKSIELKNFESFGLAFTYNTQRIEGSTLTQKDTTNLLVHGLTPSKKSPIDTIETQKHYDLFMRLVTGPKLSKITKSYILQWHRDIFGQTKIGEAGSFRSHTVGVITNPDIEFAIVTEIPKKINEFFNWLNKNELKNPVELAALTHYKFVSIHPFADGNGRISRLIMNYILFKNNCPLLIIKKNDQRRYFESLEKSQLNNDEMFFLKWFMKYYIKENMRYLKLDAQNATRNLKA